MFRTGTSCVLKQTILRRMTNYVHEYTGYAGYDPT